MNGHSFRAGGALLLDSYREMNAKRLFWIVLAVSALVVIAFAAVGLGPDGVTLFGRRTPLEFGTGFETPATFYKLIYANVGINYWIGWGAMILALISTAGIFPDFLASGSVDLYLARPIGRLKLFLIKYACGLLFVALQAAVFSIASFIVIGLRGGDWEPGLLLAIPLVVLEFSYLFGVCALVGTLTRSTTAALVVTLLAWMVMGGLQTGERMLLTSNIFNERRAAIIDRQIAQVQERVESPALADAPTTTQPASTQPVSSLIQRWTSGFASAFSPPRPTVSGNLQSQLDTLHRQQTSVQNNLHDSGILYNIVYPIETILPKTTETLDLLERRLLAAANLPRLPDESDVPTTPGAPNFRQRRAEYQYAQASVDLSLRDRPLWWVLGTSIAFEAVVVGAAAWTFCRRDF
ncbi:MAG: hypothetical protein ABSH22_11160 [Tepidisphaeraceae bacterium]|jgi:hypothetical protein